MWTHFIIDLIRPYGYERNRHHVNTRGQREQWHQTTPDSTRFWWIHLIGRSMPPAHAINTTTNSLSILTLPSFSGKSLIPMPTQLVDEWDHFLVVIRSLVRSFVHSPIHRSLVGVSAQHHRASIACYRIITITRLGVTWLPHRRTCTPWTHSYISLECHQSSTSLRSPGKTSQHSLNISLAISWRENVWPDRMIANTWLALYCTLYAYTHTHKARRQYISSQIHTHTRIMFAYWSQIRRQLNRQLCWAITNKERQI